MIENIWFDISGKLTFAIKDGIWRNDKLTIDSTFDIWTVQNAIIHNIMRDIDENIKKIKYHA